MAKVVWREWYNEAGVKQLTEMGTLPVYEIEIAAFDMTDGCCVARIIAEAANKQDSEQFRTRGELVIIEPESVAGTYEITTDYEPTFYACKSDLE